MWEVVIRIEPDGGSFVFNSHGDDSLLELGSPRIVRATNVRHDTRLNRWFVYARFSDGSETRLAEGFLKRKDALDMERRWCNQLLTAHPEHVQEVVEKAAVTDCTGNETSG